MIVPASSDPAADAGELHGLDPDAAPLESQKGGQQGAPGHQALELDEGVLPDRGQPFPTFLLILPAADLPALQAHPEARQLLACLHRYANSAAFRPEHALDPKVIRSIL